jgi:hypothetical protein
MCVDDKPHAAAWNRRSYWSNAAYRERTLGGNAMTCAKAATE